MALMTFERNECCCIAQNVRCEKNTILFDNLQGGER
jgi:hypothetical protein